MTPGQQLALEQLERVAARSHALDIVGVQCPVDQGGLLQVDVSVYCADMPKKTGGFALRDRERLTLWIGADFPYELPEVAFAHRRFAGSPHVQWGRWACLYQAPQTEWSVSAGMFGFLERLEVWLRHAAANDLDPAGAALHPPVTYHATGPLFIPRADAPVTNEQRWLGYAGLSTVGDHRIDLVRWSENADEIDTDLRAAAILLDRPMPFEFPHQFGDLLRCLNDRQAPLSDIFRLLQTCRSRNEDGQPLYVVLGTPMRRVAGGPLLQHLTAWRLEPLAIQILDLTGEIADSLAQSERLRDATGLDQIQMWKDLQQRVAEFFQRWADDATVTWCRLREARPEVTQRRDSGRPATVFAGKTIDLWGCGALGGYLAEWLVRAGVKRLTIRDNGLVTPGVLVRQPYVDPDIGRAKVMCLAQRLKLINPDCEIDPQAEDVLHIDGSAVNADLVIDATASNLVLTRIEDSWKRTSPSCPIASIAIDRSADKLFAVLATPQHCGGPLDVVRRMKLVACREPNCLPYLDAFFPETPTQPFQPEPGCSDPTFIGSAADAALLAGIAANYIAFAWQRDTKATAQACFLKSPGAPGDYAVAVEHQFRCDRIFTDPQTGYQIRVAPAAWRSIEGWKAESARTRGPDVETGGLLFGQLDETLRVIWISEASGPPPDSQHSALEFVCGVEGTQDLNAEKIERTRRSVQYVGTWHTHPVSPASPSPKDFGAMAQLLTQTSAPIERLLLLIIGLGESGEEATASVFLRTEFEQLRQRGFMTRIIRSESASPNDDVERPQVGITLSGGGSRAMAFHLGCLRALNDLGILSQADVMSTVSGGSVIGAMYAYSQDSFDKFHARVCAELQRGFISSLVRRTIISPRLLQIIGTKLTSGAVANATFVTRFVLGNIERLLPHSSKATGLWADSIQPPFRRWVSRTQAFEQTLRDRLFGDRLLTDERRSGISVVINACELRTGTAFRFGSRESGSWRYGLIEGNSVEVATAVAASAAYPALLPAIDRYFSFVNRGGEPLQRRVILTDGGVYENLGVTCMAPGRNDSYSTNVYQPRFIICCDAGPGQFSDIALPYGWMTRMRRAFETTFRQTQHGIQQQLHLWKQHAALDGFVYAYLGQQDKQLPVTPFGLVPRDQVVNYPTDFSPMSQLDIGLLSRRGEQLTRALVEYYCPNI